MIKTENLSVSLNNTQILKKVDLTVEEGEFFGILGPNGSGKTTLLKTIARLLDADSGDIAIAGNCQSIYTYKEMARKLSYVPQDTSISFDFNVKDIVAMGRHAHGRFFHRNEEDESIIKEVMLATNTWRFKDRSILSLSGGQRQLVFIAKALAQDTPLILLDEPISDLDIYYQMHILKLLEKLTEQGKTVVTVLHDLNLAARFCGKILMMKDGAVKECGTCKEVLTKETLKETYYIHAKVRKDELIQTLNVTPL